jgi:TonB-dependent SusC/RagA subfamily outer membrane receptor
MATSPVIVRVQQPPAEFALAPLYVVDGVELDSTRRVDAAVLAGAPLARIELVRSAIAVASYGERARNGAVRIATGRRAASAGVSPASAATAAEIPAIVPGVRATEAQFVTVRDAPRLHDREPPPPAQEKPLIVVDGVVQAHRNATAVDLKEFDVESIEVIKGALARKLYGTRAAAGVIFIRTRN